jgi:hypothetical protein
MKTNKYVILKKINMFLMSIFVLMLLITPNDPFNIIKACFLLLLLVNYNLILKSLYYIKDVSIFFYGFIFPILLFIFSVIIGGSVENSLAGVYFFIFLLLIFPLVKYEINYQKILLCGLLFVSAMTITFALFDLLNIIPMYKNPILNYLYFNGNVSIGKGMQFPIYYLLRFNSSPLLVFFVGYSLYKRNLLYIFIAFLASILSGTRVNILAPFIILFLFVIFIYNIRSKYRHMIILLFLILFSFMIYFLYPFIFDMFQRKVSSDAIRNLYYLSYFKLFSNIDIVLFGQGYGAFFYSYGREQFTSAAELAYWEFVRQFGLINFIVFLLFLFIPILKLYRIKEARWILISYFVYLLISYHNPNLYNSLSFLVYLLMYYSIFSFKKVKPC